MIFSSSDRSHPAPDTEEFPVLFALWNAGRELAEEFGEAMAADVTGRLLPSLLDTVTGPEAARLESGHAAACYLHRCRAACEYLCSRAQPAGEGLN